MSLKDLQHAISLMNQACGAEYIYFPTKATRKTIDSAAKLLNVSFPISYHGFLSELGFGSVKGIEFYGLTQDQYDDIDLTGCLVPDIVLYVLASRNDDELPLHIIPFCSIGDGSYYALDVSQMSDQGECPVVVWPIDGYEATPKLEIVAKDFGEFFLNMVIEEIEAQKPIDGA